MRKSLYSLILLLTAALTAMAAKPLDEAKRLYLDGKYEEALPRLEALRKSSPRDGNVNYYLGSTLYALGRYDEAEAPLKVAENRGVTDASRLRAIIALDAYRLDDASEALDTWEAKLKKNKKQAPDELGEMQSRLIMMRNMLERVEKIEIIDSLVVDADDFFTHYRLSRSAGHLVPAAEAGTDAATVVYRPENNGELIWAEADTTGTLRLMSAQILDDGTTDSPRHLDDELAGGGNADYPFLMSDGMTLYFAADGDNSLGGYDIFLTRRNDDGFFQPQNIGMPYNSPYDDYMLAIDESTGIGWWATDRNRIPGKVTIYVYITSPTRVNVDVDDPALAGLARISSIAATQTPGKDYSALRERIAAIGDGRHSTRTGQAAFEIALGNGRIARSLDDFSNARARKAMEELLANRAEREKTAAELEKLRDRYCAGDRSTAARIEELEDMTLYLDSAMPTLRNKVVRLENASR